MAVKLSCVAMREPGEFVAGGAAGVDFPLGKYEMGWLHATASVRGR